LLKSVISIVRGPRGVETIRLGAKVAMPTKASALQFSLTLSAMHKLAMSA
jgi:hypothetical protein